MCDSITNGGPVSYAQSACCPPANVIIASNVLSTNGNIYAQDGTFTGNLYVSGHIVGVVTVTGNTISNLNASNLAFGVVNSALIYGNTLSNINASNILQPFTNLVVSNSVTTTNVYTNLVQFSNTINYYQASNPVPFNGGPYTTALSSDGSTLVVGYLNGGGAIVYNIQEDSISSLDYETPYDAWSVSINAEATVIAVGDPNGNTVYVFGKSGTTWAFAKKINGTSNFGFSVSINDVGDKILTCQGADSGGWNDSGASSAYLYTFNDPNWDLTTTFPGIAGTSVALSGDGLTCVFGQSYFGDHIGRVSITKDLGATYKYFYGDVVYDGLGYNVSSNRDGTRIVANSSNGPLLNYIKIFTLT